MTDIPRWPKISLLDDPDEEERAKRQLNESRRKRGLEPLYPEAGFPPPPPGFAELVIGGGKPIPLPDYRGGSAEPEHDPDPGFHKDLVFADASPGEGQLAQAEPSPAAPGEKQSNEASQQTLLTGGYELAEIRDPNLPAGEATGDPNPTTPGKPLTYAQIKRLVHENNHSKLPDEMIIAIIFKESSFDPSARSKDPNSTETGLMQINGEAWEALHVRGLKRPKAELPDFKHAYDPATNIQRGSAYLQMRIEELGGSLDRGLASYGTGKQYAADIIAATEALQQNPGNPVAALSKSYRRKYP